MANQESQQALADEILRDGRSRADRALSRARSESERLISDARAEAKAEADKTLDGARMRGEKRAEMVVRSAEQEIQRRKLRVREEAVAQTVGAARDELRRLSGETYRRSVARLAAEAIREMPGEGFTLRVGTLQGEEFDASALGEELTRTLAETSRHVALRVEAGETYPRGVIVESSDARVRWDNTYEGRLRRLRGGLRRLFVPVLFEEKT
jgi:vacuolar-type H+-ATPase subunit E/Vma4